MCAFRFCSIAAAVLAFAASAATASAGTFATLYKFTDANTGGPIGRLYLHDGALYGTGSGFNSESGDGQVFELRNSGGSWKFKTLLAFDGRNGSLPRGGLVADAAGALYGTAEGGGTHRYGTVFKLWKSGGSWRSAVLKNFSWDDPHGTEPDSDLVMDRSGALLGATIYGGQEQGGTIFSLVPSGGDWKEKMIWRFTNNYDGHEPWAVALRASDDALYGTTYHGGMYDYGMVYQLVHAGGHWTETKIHMFSSVATGVYPTNGLVEGDDGTLYGTTLFGGLGQYGTVFSLKKSGGDWTETVLHYFGSGNDGQEPYGGLLWLNGTLYGTTEFGGTNGAGTIFALNESGGTWTETVLYNFSGGADGALPCASLIADDKGNLYGTAFEGGQGNNGTVFEFTP